MNKQQLAHALALRTGKHVDILMRYKEDVLRDMWNEATPLKLNYEQVSQICRSLITTGGASYRHSDGILNPAEGYMVALTGFEKKLPRVWNTEDLMETLNSWFADIRYTGDSAAFIGLWEHEGILYLDLAQRFIDRDKAIAMGKARNQLAIWDCNNKCEIKTS